MNARLEWRDPFAGLVDVVAEKACGGRPLAILRRQQNSGRTTYEVTLETGRAFLKLEAPGRPGGNDLALEAWATREAARAGLPAPEVLCVDCSEREFPVRYMLTGAIEGVALEDAGLPFEAEAAVLREAGRLIRRLHQVHIRGFGPLDEDVYLQTGAVQGSRETWRDVVDGVALSAVTYLARQRVLGGRETEAVLARLKEVSIPDLESGRLLHGDFDRSHIFVAPATGRLTGVIDFGDRESGDPEWEMSIFWLWEDARRLSILLEGYREAGGGIDERLLNRYALGRLLWRMQRLQDAGAAEKIMPLRSRLVSMISQDAP